jgi:hypothetical protein
LTAGPPGADLAPHWAVARTAASRDSFAAESISIARFEVFAPRLRTRVGAKCAPARFSPHLNRRHNSDAEVGAGLFGAELDLTGEDLTCLGWRFADDFSWIFSDDAPDLEALAPSEAFHAEWAIRHPNSHLPLRSWVLRQTRAHPGGN